MTSKPPSPVLVALDGPAAGVQIPIPVEGIRIGRDTVPALRVDQAVSGRHASIRWTGDGRLLIEDEGSRNGTWVNGTEVTQPTGLGAGDRVQMGDGTYELRIERVAPPAPSYPIPPDNRETVEIQGGVKASDRGVAAGRDIHGNIHTGDDIDVFYDPTGLSDVSGFPRFLMVLGIFIALAGFALFAYPIVMGLISAGDASAAHAAYDQQFDPATQANFDCHFNVNSGFTFQVAPWIPVGAGLLFVGMVLTIVARVMQRNEPDGRRRRS